MLPRVKLEEKGNSPRAAPFKSMAATASQGPLLLLLLALMAPLMLVPASSGQEAMLQSTPRASHTLADCTPPPLQVRTSSRSC
eukprot:1151588-Pelagomonas_calceolata.AAC.2